MERPEFWIEQPVDPPGAADDKGHADVIVGLGQGIEVALEKTFGEVQKEEILRHLGGEKIAGAATRLVVENIDRALLAGHRLPAVDKTLM